MTWLLKFFPGTWWLYAVAAGVIFAAGGTAAWTVQGWRLDKVQAQYDGFVSTTKTQGEAAEKVAKAQETQDKLNKRKADDENKQSLDTLRADNKRLRDSRASSNYVPPASPGASRPDLACFDRAELESAIQLLDGRVSPIVEKGSEAVVNLDTAKKWAEK